MKPNTLIYVRISPASLMDDSLQEQIRDGIQYLRDYEIESAAIMGEYDSGSNVSRGMIGQLLHYLLSVDAPKLVLPRSGLLACDAKEDAYVQNILQHNGIEVITLDPQDAEEADSCLAKHLLRQMQENPDATAFYSQEEDASADRKNADEVRLAELLFDAVEACDLFDDRELAFIRAGRNAFETRRVV